MSDIFSEDLQNNRISRSIFYTCTSNLNSNQHPNLHVLTVMNCDILSSQANKISTQRHTGNDA